VLAADKFHVVGPATDVPLQFTARLGCAGTEYSNGNLREGYSGAVSTGMDVTVALSHLVGEEFILLYGARAVSDLYDSSSIACDLVFEGLPAGYSIASCAGYPSPVGVRSVTWGMLKNLYR
jgi:hypothetical protein